MSRGKKNDDASVGAFILLILFGGIYSFIKAHPDISIIIGLIIIIITVIIVRNIKKQKEEYRRKYLADLTHPAREELAKIDRMDGRTFEFWCADLLKQCNYKKVIVTKGSGDQGVDIICEKDGKRIAVQCKCYSKDLSNKPIQEVFTGKKMYGCDTAIVMTNRYFTNGAIELANRTGVILYDRDKIFEMLKSTTPRSN